MPVFTDVLFKLEAARSSQEWKDLCLQCFCDPKINGFPGLIVEHFCVKFGYTTCSGSWDTMRKKQTQRCPLELYPWRNGCQY